MPKAVWNNFFEDIYQAVRDWKKILPHLGVTSCDTPAGQCQGVTCLAAKTPKPWHGHSWPGTGPGPAFPALGSCSHDQHWGTHLTQGVCGLLFQPFLNLHSFINSLQPFWSKFSVFNFALSSSAPSESRDEELPQPASLETSQYFQVTAFAIWCFLLPFKIFLDSLQPGKCHVQKEMKVPYICHVSRFAKYVVVGYLVYEQKSVKILFLWHETS